jgi:hypothetical protein
VAVAVAVAVVVDALIVGVIVGGDGDVNVSLLSDWHCR